MSKKVVILQSNYLPWRGYFDLINACDLFIFLDDVQYTKTDWRNRNKIKTANGTAWLSIPCGKVINRKICEVNISSNLWQKKHWKSIWNNYSSAPFFKLYKIFFEDFYLHHIWNNLSDLNQYLIKKIAKEFLGVKASFEDSRNFNVIAQRQDRIIEILKKTQATEYISGPAGKNYIDEKRFEDEGIKLTWFDYSGYKPYTQLFGEFNNNVSIIDLLFNTGLDAKKFLKTNYE